MNTATCSLLSSVDAYIATFPFLVPNTYSLFIFYHIVPLINTKNTFTTMQVCVNRLLQFTDIESEFVWINTLSWQKQV